MKRKIWVLVLVAGLCVLFAGITVFSSWMGGMTLGLMGNAEQTSIVNVRFVEGAPAGDTVKVTVQNHGGTTSAIVSGYANGIKAINIDSGQAFVIPKASSLEVTLSFPNGTLVYENQYNVKLITAKGTSLMNTWVYDSKSTSQYDPLKDEGALPIPIPETASTLDQFWTPYITTVAVVTSGVAFFSVLGACKLAHYIVRPKNKTELYVLLFFVTLIVLFAIVAVLSITVFAPTITL